MNYSPSTLAIPAHLKAELRRYIDYGTPPSDFMIAVLFNDFMSACGHAENEGIGNLTAFAVYLYNEAPNSCFGSESKVIAWINSHAQARVALRTAAERRLAS